MLKEGWVRETVVRLLTEQQWSPEEISQRIKLEQGQGVVSYTTIYRALHSGLMEGKGTKKNRHGRYPMEKHLRRKGWKSRKKAQKKAEEVVEVICRLLRGLPEEYVRSLTLDRGTEFAEHRQITKALPSLQVYFTHPMSPWERGTNENLNGLLRQYIPKHTYKVPFSAELLAEFTDKLNHRPRKCLNWYSPFEVFSRSLLHLT